MPEPFKNLLSKEVIHGIATHFKKQWPQFNRESFITGATKNLDSLELKQRSGQITQTMITCLPADFEKVGEIMLASLGTELEDDLSAGEIDSQGIVGWAVIPMVHYVGLKGQGHFDLSMTLLKEMTKRCSSEFGIRFFLLQSTEKTLSVLKTWTEDSNHHVRRLVSEGTRPRLPWAMRLPMFIKDPEPVIELLERLKDDEKEYVRRSVANNLNDIAKDHPNRVAQIAGQWLKNAGKSRKRLVRHGCRTLIKNGHEQTLKVLGYKAPNINEATIDIETPKVEFGNFLQFTLSLTSASGHSQPVIIDYIIHHRKANGGTSPKVFKWRKTTLPTNKKLVLTKKHTIKKITTRVYYGGLHRIEVMVNGVTVASAEFELVIP